jgi:hypothetical protein
MTGFLAFFQSFLLPLPEVLIAPEKEKFLISLTTDFIVSQNYLSGF